VGQLIGEARTAISPDLGSLRADLVCPERPQAHTGSDRIRPDQVRSGRAGGTQKGPDRAGACQGPADDDHLQPVRDTLPDDLSHDGRTAALGFIDDWTHVFSKGEFDMGRTKVIPQRIDTEGHKPFRQPLHRHPRVYEEFIDAQVDKMLRHDVIEPAASPWASNVVLAKKSDGLLRFCFDYRQLNELTYKDSYPLPWISACLDALGARPSTRRWTSAVDSGRQPWTHVTWTRLRSSRAVGSFVSKC